MNDNYFSSLVLYYGRSRFYYSMQKVALDGLAKYPMQSKFRFFNGMALVLGNTYLQEGIRELSPLRNEPDFELAATMALIYAHKCCRIVDQDALLIQERRLNDARNSTNPTSYYYAALFLYLRSEIDLARKYADKATKIDANFDLAVVLKAWCDLSSIQPMTGNMQQILESCITHSDGKNIDASLALVRFYQTRGNFEEAVLTLNKISVRYPELNIPLIEKMETHLAARHWDHAMETSMRVINLDPNNIAALRVKCIILIGRESNFKPAVSTLQQLLTAVERIESGNHSLILQICRLFSKICSRNADILQITLRYVDKINEISPGNLDILTELGYQRLLQNNLTGAEAAFRAASNINGSNFNAVCGMTLCKIKAQRDDKDIQYIKQQLAFLNDLCGNEKVPIILYMSALLPGQGQETSVQLLIQAFERHVQVLQASLVGVNYINLLNPDFLLELTVELLRHRPIPISLKTKTDLCFELSHHETLNITLKHCRSILEIITHVFPGHMQALYMIAKIEFFCGEFTNAIWRLKNILHINEMYTDARLLLAEVFVQENQMPEALHSLELALSHNFAVRERPMYHLLLGIIQRHHQLSEAHQSFLNAMQLIGDRPIEQYGEHNPQCQTFNENTFTKSDKMTLYLELIYTLRDIGDAQSVYESERLLQTAMDEFSGTAEEGRLIIVHADIMLQKYNVSKAISLLSAIKPSHPYFLQAKTNLANVHLVHRKDRAAFSKCFTELVQARPEPESYLMLGDAYMSIQEAELAINAYQNAFSMNKNNSILASKLGRAFVKTHQYSSALKYYHEAIQNPGCSSLKLDLAELYLKLKQYQNAIDALTAGARNKSLNDDNVLELQLWTKQLLLLARVYEKSGNADESLQTLKEARDNQYRLQKRFSIDADQSETLFEQYKLLSKICLRMAQHLINKRDKEQECVKCIEECLKYASNDPKVLVPLARLYMQLNLVESCREMCLQILQIDSNNEDASVMMADLSFRKKKL
ncbi:tetratricopeptide repeat protein 21B-like isoform X3 [Scaptodrosophila lebanonensis]|uniref:Tetratricopeptide repeat protein 21B-like isoform X2 n=1 Tax=Drosophila lebanonensis TaxID=7225 RepID=A0A6J2U1C1_DROLE|nr:tetratricopeptide repeat protein 21B-like isoform X2 [Scaptodrosophila lebanonensis]XP_030382482.1 tetratricopeptide repeat protein 21B-like isoform X3 [Scaptodrosophila lebanonensis]